MFDASLHNRGVNPYDSPRAKSCREVLLDQYTTLAPKLWYVKWYAWVYAIFAVSPGYWQGLIHAELARIESSITNKTRYLYHPASDIYLSYSIVSDFSTVIIAAGLIAYAYNLVIGYRWFWRVWLYVLTCGFLFAFLQLFQRYGIYSFFWVHWEAATEGYPTAFMLPIRNIPAFITSIISFVVFIRYSTRSNVAWSQSRKWSVR